MGKTSRARITSQNGRTMAIEIPCGKWMNWTGKARSTKKKRKNFQFPAPWPGASRAFEQLDVALAEWPVEIPGCRCGSPELHQSHRGASHDFLRFLAEPYAFCFWVAKNLGAFWGSRSHSHDPNHPNQLHWGQSNWFPEFPWFPARVPWRGNCAPAPANVIPSTREQHLEEPHLMAEVRLGIRYE